MSRSTPLRVVVDTNVVFEGLTCRGNATGLIVEAWLAVLFQPCVSNALAYEYVDVHALTRQSVNAPVRELSVETISAQPDLEVDRQRSLFEALKGGLGEAVPADIDAILADRDVVSCEPELTTETIERLQAKLQAVKH